MAMNAAALKSEMKSSVLTAMSSRGFNIGNPDTNGEADKYLDALCEAISQSVVDHITANAVAKDQGTDPAPAGDWPIE